MTTDQILQIALENKQAMDEAMRLADGAHRAKRQFASVPAAPSAFGSLGDLTALRFPHGSLGEECEFPERDACEIDDERDQGPLYDAPTERSMGRA